MTKLIETAVNLISIQSVADRPDELYRSIKFVEDFFAHCPKLKIKKFEHNGKYSIVISTVETLTPDILMVGHLDVVPAPNKMFEPRIEGVKLIGRGACDMKSENAVMMHVLREVVQDDCPPSVALMLTTDEEVGGRDGVHHLVDDMGYRCKVALVPDGGEAAKDIVTESKGVLQVRIVSQGVNAHGSVPWQGQNAIEKLLDACQNIRDLFHKKDTEDHWYTTFNIGTIVGGSGTNQVPADASCTIDIRYPSSISKKEILSRIKKAVSLCEVKVILDAGASKTDSNNPAVKSYIESMIKIYGTNPNLCRNHSAHDGRFFTNYGIPVIVSRPESGAQHSDDEWVDICSLESFYLLYLDFVRSFR